MGLKVRWSKQLEGLVRVPVHAEHGRALVVRYSEQLHAYVVEAFCPDDGSLEWTRRVRSGGYGAPVAHDGRLAVISNHTGVECLSTATGEPLWRFESSARIRSPLVVLDDHVVLSSGGTLLALDPSGRVARRLTAPGTFLFGACARGRDGLILSLGSTGERDGSTLQLLAFDDEGVRWSCPLGPGTVASSDTSGVLVHDGVAHVGASGRLFAVDSHDGGIRWSTAIAGLAHRSLCTTDGVRLYATTVEGEVFALELRTGALLWRRQLSAEGIWSPATALADALLVVAGGALWLLDAASGATRDSVPVGHSPYSAAVVRGRTVLLGAGDPPYLGLLWCLDLQTEAGAGGIRCEATSELVDTANSREIELAIRVRGASAAVEAITLDATALGGGAVQLRPRPRSLTPDADDCVFFARLPLAVGRRHGSYALPVEVHTVDGTVSSAVLVTLRYTGDLPERVLLTEVRAPTQQGLQMSGAACIQALRGMFGGDELDQAEVRRMAEEVLARSKYEPFDIWRIIARRLLLSSATSVETLPEVVDARRP